MSEVHEIQIEDDLSIQSNAAIEVVIELKNREKRWCFVFTPEGMANCGDWINGTQIRFHYGSPHMIVIAETLTEEIIRKAICDIDAKGIIIDCTLPCEESAQKGGAPEAFGAGDL